MPPPSPPGGIHIKKEGGGDWPTIKGALTPGLSQQGSKSIDIDELTSKQLITLLKGGTPEQRLEKELLSKAENVLPQPFDLTLDVLGQLTNAATQQELAKYGTGAKRQASKDPGTDFFLTVVYTTKGETQPAPIGQGAPILSRQYDLKGVRVYLYWFP